MTEKIVIIGTGLAGMLQALALAEQNIPVTLIGPEPHHEADHRTTAILNQGIAYLDQLDLWQGLEHSTPLVTMELIDGNRQTTFDASEINEPQFGFNIRNNELKKRLVARIENHSQIIWYKLTAHKPVRNTKGWQITLDNGKKIDCTLLIGADGRDSMTREAAGISISEKIIDQTALVAMLDCEKPHYNTTVEWYRKGGPLTLVPVDKKRFAMVWCNPAETAKQKKKSPQNEVGNELTELTGNRFGRITLANPLQAWKARPFIADKFYVDHCVLIGEAAHVLPPIGAQGFNLGLHDVHILTEILSKAKQTGQNFSNPVLLRQYHRKRQPEAAKRYHAINTLNATLLSPNALVHKLRQLSLSGVQHFDFIKKQLMDIGMHQNDRKAS